MWRRRPTQQRPGQPAGGGPAAFLGTWQYQKTSKASFSCNDGTSFVATFDGTETETFAAGVQANELAATDDTGCPATCAVDGATATCAGQACDGITVTSDVFTVAGGELHEVTNGTAQLDDGTLCDFSGTGVLDRI